MTKINRMSWLYKLFCKAIGVGFIMEIVLIMIPTLTSASTADQLDTCKNAVVGIVGIPSSIVKVSVRVSNDHIVYPNIVDAVVTKPFDLPRNDVTILTSNVGSCEFNSSGKLVKIDTFFYSGQSPREFKDFGEFPDLGRYIVIIAYLGERKVGLSYMLYYLETRPDGENSDIFFPVLLNDKKEWWWTDCRTKKIGRLNSDGIKEISLTSQNVLSTAVSNFVCGQ
ncbi:hypothetical protein QUA82_04365 [Microcoleus sp. F8-D3]